VIVLNDADLDKAVELTIAGAMLSTGQKCTATSRVIVHRDVLGDFRDRLVARASGLKVGDGMKPDTYMGPLVSADAEKTVLDYIEVGKREGARLLTGGTKLKGGDLDRGYFVAPTVFDGVRSGCGSRRRRSSARWWPCWRRKTSTRPSPSPTIRASGSALPW
jgi:aldehyde dehydrogenase (NAD+)